MENLVQSPSLHNIYKLPYQPPRQRITPVNFMHKRVLSIDSQNLIKQSINSSGGNYDNSSYCNFTRNGAQLLPNFNNNDEFQRTGSTMSLNQNIMKTQDSVTMIQKDIQNKKITVLPKHLKQKSLSNNALQKVNYIQNLQEESKLMPGATPYLRLRQEKSKSTIHVDTNLLPRNIISPNVQNSHRKMNTSNSTLSLNMNNTLENFNAINNVQTYYQKIYQTLDQEKKGASQRQTSSHQNVQQNEPIYQGNIFKVQKLSTQQILGRVGIKSRQNDIQMIQQDLPDTLQILKKNLQLREQENKSRQNNNHLHNLLNSSPRKVASSNRSSKMVTTNTQTQSYLASQVLLSKVQVPSNRRNTNSFLTSDKFYSQQNQDLNLIQISPLTQTTFFQKRQIEQINTQSLKSLSTQSQTFSPLNINSQKNLTSQYFFPPTICTVNTQKAACIQTNTSQSREELDRNQSMKQRKISSKSFANLLKSKILQSENSSYKLSIEQNLSSSKKDLSHRQLNINHQQQLNTQKFYRTYLKPNSYYFGKMTTEEELIKAKKNFEQVAQQKQIEIICKDKKKFITVFPPAVQKQQLNMNKSVKFEQNSSEYEISPPSNLNNKMGSINLFDQNLSVFQNNGNDLRMNTFILPSKSANNIVLTQNYESIKSSQYDSNYDQQSPTTLTFLHSKPIFNHKNDNQGSEFQLRLREVQEENVNDNQIGLMNKAKKIISDDRHLKSQNIINKHQKQQKQSKHKSVGFDMCTQTKEESSQVTENHLNYENNVCNMQQQQNQQFFQIREEGLIDQSSLNHE